MATTRGVLLAVLAVDVLGAGVAAADGERTPMCGVAVIGAESARTTDQRVDLAGVALDFAWWYGRFGLAAEGSGRWSIDDPTRAFVAGASARVLLYEGMAPALAEPRDVEVGVELQAIAERTWWYGTATGVDPTAYGVGLAVRLRGTGDLDTSTLIAESRFFIRASSAPYVGVEPEARTMTATTAAAPRAWTVLVGIGASWGSGTASYLDRFRMRPFGSTVL